MISLAYKMSEEFLSYQSWDMSLKFNVLSGRLPQTWKYSDEYHTTQKRRKSIYIWEAEASNLLVFWLENIYLLVIKVL